MRISSTAATSVGNVREINEDCYFCDEDLGLFVVCDGMGGHAAGDIAAKRACETTVDYIRKNKEATDLNASGPRRVREIALLAQAAVEDACSAVFSLSQEKVDYAGMGCTLTMVLLLKDFAVMGHVGDSRLYFSRGGALSQLSADHTFAQELVKEGRLSPEDASDHPHSSILTRAIGQYNLVDVDTLVFEVVPGDRLMICSDGTYAAFQDLYELGALIDNKSSSSSAAQLVETAVARDGSDNATAIVIEVEGDGDPEEEKRAADVKLKIERLQEMYLFEYLELNELLYVMESVEVTDAKKGDVLIQEGEKSDGFYVILSGAVEVTRGLVSVADLGAGNHFGEMALLQEIARTASVTATEDCRLLLIRHKAFKDIVRGRAEIGVKLLWSLGRELSDRIKITNAKLEGVRQ